MDSKPKKQFIYSVAVLIGTMVGVGVFGLPLVFAKAGFGVGLLFLIVLTLITILTNLAYGEVILRTTGIHQIAGYARSYLGIFESRIVTGAFIFSGYGALLAYIIISGSFLSQIFSFISDFYGSILFFVFMSVIVLFGLKTVARTDLIMVATYALIIFLVAFWGLWKINFNNFLTFQKEEFFLPYGVILFALAGMSAVPLQRELLKGREHLFRKSIIWGVLIPACLYLIFTFTVVGLSGEHTTPDSVLGLIGILNTKMVLVLTILGLMTISTSFVSLSTALIEVFSYDFGISKFFSWLFTVGLPMVFFLFITRNFIDVLELVGSLSISLLGIMIILMYLKARSIGRRKPEFTLNLPAWACYLIIAVFACGGIYTLLK